VHWYWGSDPRIAVLVGEATSPISPRRATRKALKLLRAEPGRSIVVGGPAEEFGPQPAVEVPEPIRR
jgi:hypothetical protein